MIMTMSTTMRTTANNRCVFSLAGVQLKFSAVMEASGGLDHSCGRHGRIVDRQAAFSPL